MANNYYLIKDPLSAVQSVRLERFADGGFGRNLIGRRIGRFNSAGRPSIVGPNYGHRYQWPLRVVVLPEDRARLQIYSHLLDQGNRSHLVFEDRMKPVIFDPISPQKQAISGTTKSIDGYTEGFLTCAVEAVLGEENPVEGIGCSMDIVTLTLYEIPGISV